MKVDKIGTAFHSNLELHPRHPIGLDFLNRSNASQTLCFLTQPGETM